MESILNDIYDLIDLIMKTDPAIYRVMIYDPNGTEIYQYSKMWNRTKKYPSVGSMISQIFKNSDKFFGFLRNSARQKFTFHWYFDGVVIYAADTPYGYIAVMCEPDVDLGFVKNILMRQTVPKFIEIMRPIQD